MKKRTKQIGGGILVGVALLSIFGIIKYFQIQAAMAEHANAGPPPQAVTTEVIQEYEWEKVLPAVGDLAPLEGAELTFQSSGVIRTISFNPGETVKVGSLLAQLDVSVEQAELAAAQAELQLAQQEFRRYEKLLRENATSRSEYERRQAEFRALQAKLASLKATISRRTIIAPFDGTLGVQQVAVGEYINAGERVVSLVNLEELYVNFTIPERWSTKVQSGNTIRFRSDALPDDVFTAEISSIDPIVTAATRNLGVQAKTKNTDHKLRPGMFVEVEIVLPETETHPGIPISSVQYAPYGDTVYVVQRSETKDEAKQQLPTAAPRNVRLGTQKGDKVAVLQGLKAGDEVVSSGGFKLFPNAPLIINNSITPDSSFSPNPPNT
jgi:membrane fusion protein (multidrug efflux system)